MKTIKTHIKAISTLLFMLVFCVKIFSVLLPQLNSSTFGKFSNELSAEKDTADENDEKKESKKVDFFMEQVLFVHYITTGTHSFFPETYKLTTTHISILIQPPRV